MKKWGIAIIAILVIVMAVVGSVTYAFFTSSQAEFTMIVQSAQGSAINLDLVAASTGLVPASTSAGVNNYSPKTAPNGEQYASYAIGYTTQSASTVDLYVKDIVFTYADETGLTDLQKQALHNERDEYFMSIIDFCITFTQNTYDWTKTYLSDDALTVNVAQGSGTFYFYIRFNVSQELVPPFYDNAKISFTLVSEEEE